MMKPTKELIEIAHHEAGHAVACVVQRLPFDHASIVKHGDYLGEVVHPSAFMFEARDRRAIARGYILVSYAGTEAERLVNPDPPDYSWAQDRANAFEASREYCIFPRYLSFVGDEFHLAYLDRLRVESRRLVRKHRRAIEVAAAALLVHRTVLAADFERIIAPFV